MNTTKSILFSIVCLLITLGSTKIVSAQVSACNEKMKYGQDSVECVKNLSLFREPVKQKNYKDAYKPWKWVYENCPCASQFTFVDGVKIMEYRLEQEKDPARRNAIIDSLLGIYDARIKYFPINPSNGQSQVGSILTRKALDCFTYKPDKPEEAFEIIKRAIELDGAEVLPNGLQLYIEAAIEMVKKEQADKTLVVDVYDQLSDLMDIAMDNAQSDSAAIKKYFLIKNNIEVLFEPFATCEDLVNIYQSKFEQSPNDTTLLMKITKILDKKQCTDKELFFAATENLHKIKPSANSAYLMAIKYMKEEKWDIAKSYLEESLDLYKPDELNKKARAYHLLGQIYLNEKNYSATRNMAQKILEINPNNGEAYILIGDAYALSAAQCGDNELTKRTPYWAAVDKYIQARRLDPRVEETAKKRIATYSSYFPSMETIFFYGLKEGESYKVECWINETTTVRPAR